MTALDERLLLFRIPGQADVHWIGLVHGDDQHAESAFEEHENDEKLHGVHNEAADDDGPWPKQVVERQKVQNLFCERWE